MIRFPSSSAAVLAALACVISIPWAWAQDVQEAGTEVREERSVQMSEQTYRRLTAIHELLGTNEIDEALTRLEALKRQNLTVYEEALIYQTEGFCHAQKGDYRLAIDAFQRCLDMDVLSNLAQQGTRYSLAGLLAGEERFDDAISTMLVWLRFAQEPVPADAYMLIGSGYAELTRLASALPYVQEAIRRGERPNESWYMLELSIHFENMDYPGAADLLRRMVVLWPDRARLWDMLASAYLELGDDASALATLMVAYKKDLIQEENRLLHLAHLNMFLEIPYEAGRILEAEIATGRISSEQDNLELLLSAWTAAREFERAVEVIDELALLSTDGGYFLQKAQLLNEQGEWSGVVDAAAGALEQGGLDEVGDVWILKGMAHTELEQYEEALTAFQEASRTDDESRRNAQAWIEYVRDRRRVAMSRR